MKRCDIEERYKWDNTNLYKSFKEWEQDAKKVPKLIEEVLKYKGHLMDSANNLLGYFKASEEAEKVIEFLEFYTFLQTDVNINDEEASKFEVVINNIIGKYSSAVSFVTTEILESNMETIDGFIAEKPELAKYERILKEPFRLKDHILDEKTEAIFAEMQLANQNYCKSSQFIRSKELRFDPITLSNGEVIELNDNNAVKYLRSDDRETRRQTAVSETKAYEHNINSLATNYIGFVKNIEIEAKYRGYASKLDGVLQERKIPRKVYDKLMGSFKKYSKFYTKYVELYKSILGLENICAYDLSASLIKEGNHEYSIEDARKMILDTYSFYGKWYTDILNMAFDERLIDVMPSDEKISGWYSAYIPYAKPRVFGSFYNKIIDISSLCHELGHFVNQFLSTQNQIPQEIYLDTSTGEVASLINEIVFSNKIRKDEADPDVALAVINNFLKLFAGNYFGAGRQALWEEKVHTLILKGEPVSASVFNELWLEASKEILGDSISDYASNSWAKIPHFYMGDGYYVYNYAIAIIAATNVATKILEGEEGFMDKYHEFLKMGSNIDPMDALMSIGIDLTSDAPYDKAIEMFDKMIDEFIKVKGI